MKVLFCDNSLRNLFNFRGDVIHSFLKKGWNVVIVVPDSEANDLSIIPDGITVYQLSVNPSGLNPLADMRYLWALIKVYCRECPDFIFHYTIKPNIYGTFAARLTGKRTIAMVAGLGYIFTGNSFAKRFGRALYKVALRLSHRVIVLNKANHDLLLERGFVSNKRIILLTGGEGVNLSRFFYQPKVFNETRFLMIARVLYDKGYTEFAEAAEMVKAKYPNTKIELLGPMAEDSPMGVSKCVVNSDVEAGKFSYLGETSDVTEYLKQDGVVVVCSSYHEGLNRSLMEACAMGCPAITTNIPGCRETVEEGENGLLVPVKDSKALASAMIRMLELTADEKQTMSCNAHQRAKKLFNVDSVISVYENIVNSL